MLRDYSEETDYVFGGGCLIIDRCVHFYAPDSSCSILIAVFVYVLWLCKFPAKHRHFRLRILRGSHETSLIPPPEVTLILQCREHIALHLQCILGKSKVGPYIDYNSVSNEPNSTVFVCNPSSLADDSVSQD